MMIYLSTEPLTAFMHKIIQLLLLPNSANMLLQALALFTSFAIVWSSNVYVYPLDDKLILWDPDTMRNYTEATDFCRLNRGTLIIIRGPIDFYFLQGPAKNAQFWIGVTPISLRDKHPTQYVDGTDITWENWDDDYERKNVTANPPCFAATSLSSTGKWAVDPCSDKYLTICETKGAIAVLNDQIREMKREMKSNAESSGEQMKTLATQMKTLATYAVGLLVIGGLICIQLLVMIVKMFLTFKSKSA